MKISYPESLRALSIRQPFASMICFGDKSEEYRSRRTHRRGVILLHASSLPESDWREYFSAFGYPFSELHVGAIIGAARLFDCAESISGGFIWRLSGAFLLPEKPRCKGRLSFWRPLDKEQDYAFRATWSQLPDSLKK